MDSKHFPIPQKTLVEYFNRLQDHLFVAKQCNDGDFEIISGNAGMLNFFGLEPENVIGRTLRQLLGKGAAAERVIETYQQVLDTGRHIVYEEDSGDTEFDYEVFETSLFRFQEPGTGDYLIGGISRNISLRKSIEESLELSKRKLESKVRELEVVHRQLEEESMRDPLTSLLNRRHLEEFMNHEIARAKRQQIPLTVMMLDLDNFKELNDGQGHQAGDQVLRDVGRFFRSTRRGSDIIFRFGGDVFLIILPATTEEQAKKLAACMHKDIEEVRFSEDLMGYKMTMSIGIASYPDHASGTFELIEQADAALFKAKKLGKNRTAASGANF